MLRGLGILNLVVNIAFVTSTPNKRRISENPILVTSFGPLWVRLRENKVGSAPLAGRLFFLYSSPHMKKDIHPEQYRPVIFEDVSSGAKFLIHSTVDAEETGKWEDGKEYPLFKIEISSASHPVYTGEAKSLDTTGRAEKFRARQAAAKKK